jgi:hypothetical protein
MAASQQQLQADWAARIQQQHLSERGPLTDEGGPMRPKMGRPAARRVVKTGAHSWIYPSCCGRRVRQGRRKWDGYHLDIHGYTWISFLDIQLDIIWIHKDILNGYLMDI